MNSTCIRLGEKMSLGMSLGDLVSAIEEFVEIKNRILDAWKKLPRDDIEKVLDEVRELCKKLEGKPTPLGLLALSALISSLLEMSPDESSRISLLKCIPVLTHIAIDIFEEVRKEKQSNGTLVR